MQIFVEPEPELPFGMARRGTGIAADVDSGLARLQPCATARGVLSARNPGDFGGCRGPRLGRHKSVLSAES